MAMNLTNLTYRQLKEMVPATPRGKMPKATKLHETPILFSEEIDGATIVVYENGYLTYTTKTASDGRDGYDGRNASDKSDRGNKSSDLVESHTTVYSVHKCSKIVFMTGFSDDEYKEECGCYGEHSKIEYRVVENPVTRNRQLTRIVTVDEKAYQDNVWWLPVVVICDERLGYNDYARFMNNLELKDNDDLTDDGYEGDEGRGSHNPEDWLDAIAQSEEDERNHNILVAGMKTLTKIQYKTVELYYKEGLSEREIAKLLGTKQQSVHDNLQAALKRLRKKFF